ncbi:hypothetical protein D3C72_1965550 [compost metagenome]
MAKLEQARQVEADHGKQGCQQCHHQGRLQLKAPAQLLPGGTEDQQEASQRQEGQHHACCVGQACHALLAQLVAVAGEAQHLDGQDREHAGHQVQDEATDQAAQQSQP